ncbi:MAG: hypothetical protein GY754_31600 [bacterium]|nr:hypothetical protein [bacterium]
MEQLVFHRCENCGSPLKVDPNLENAICQYCLSAFKLDRNSSLEPEDDLTSEEVIRALKAIPGPENNMYITHSHVYLSESEAADSDMAMISKLKTLEHLSLTETKVTDEGLIHLQKLSRLKCLYLDRTAISDFGLSILRSLPCLEELDLSFTNITDAGLAHLTGIQTLKILTLHYTNISEHGILQLLALPGLTELEIDMDKFKILPILKAGGDRFFKSETSLDLDAQGLNDSETAFLGEFKKLELLTLNNNNITGPGLANLKGLRHLKTLYLENNPLGKESAAHICNLKRLKRLNILKTGLETEDIDIIKKTFPRAQIFY